MLGVVQTYTLGALHGIYILSCYGMHSRGPQFTWHHELNAMLLWTEFTGGGSLTPGPPPCSQGGGTWAQVQTPNQTPQCIVTHEWNLSSLFRWTCCGNTSWSYHNKFLTVFDVLEHWYVTEEVTSSNRIKKSVRSYVIEYVYKNICKQLIFHGFLQVDIKYMILPSWNQFLCKDTVQEFPCGSVN